MTYKGAIVIQGPSQYVGDLKKAWNGYNLIWSTWIGDETHYDDTDIVIYNELPKDFGTRNIALQQKTTLSGIVKAKELGFQRVLKWRSDMIPTNINDFMGLFDLRATNFLFFHDVRGGYFIDYFMEGDINTISNIWSFSNIHPLFPESAITEQIKMMGLKDIVFIGNLFDEANDIFWLKNKIMLSSYKDNPQFVNSII